MMLNGEKMQSLLMTVIRFVMPVQDHTIKKMLLVFWEVVPKYTADGKMLHEMILVCDAYRKVYILFIFYYCIALYLILARLNFYRLLKVLSVSVWMCVWVLTTVDA